MTQEALAKCSIVTLIVTVVTNLCNLNCNFFIYNIYLYLLYISLSSYSFLTLGVVKGVKK